MHRENRNHRQKNKCRNIKLIIAYDGIRYKGWQRLGGDESSYSIQKILEGKLSELLGEEIEITGASRTDAFVSAYGQVANFKTSSTYDIEKLRADMNVRLPQDIQIRQVEEVSLSFHSRYDATGKLYEYCIELTDKPDVFHRTHRLAVGSNLNIDQMTRAAKLLEGCHDFKGYSSTMKDHRATIKTIESIQIIQEGQVVTIQIRGDGFLYNMIRIIVGTLIEVGKHKRTIESVAEVLERGERELAGPTVIGNGLILKEVFY